MIKNLLEKAGIFENGELPALILSKALTIILIVILWYIIWLVVTRVIKKIISTKKAEKAISERKIRILDQILNNFVKYGVWFVVICQILEEFGVSVAGILAVAGVGGLAIGFGAQTVVKDIITGLFIIVEDQFTAGDTITVNGMTGKVESIGVRTTRLRSQEDELFIIPNSQISVVTNKTKKK